MPPQLYFFLLTAIALGTILVFSSSHWLLAWMGLEINTLAILPLMVQKYCPREVEAATKYFLIQAAAAMVLLFSALTQAGLTGEWGVHQISEPFAVTMAVLGLAMKLGLAPAHFWLPDVIHGLSLPTGLIVSTWQKLAPFALLLQVAPLAHPALLVLIGLGSILAGGWGGLNQTQVRKVLAYSSIAHLGWIVLIIQLAPVIAILNVLVYIAMASVVFMALKAAKCTTLNGIATCWTKSPVVAVLLALALLSLGGLPPLSGFVPKWMAMTALVKAEFAVSATSASLTSLLSLFYYIRYSYASMVTEYPKMFTPTVYLPLKRDPAFTAFMVVLASITLIATAALPVLPLFLIWYF